MERIEEWYGFVAGVALLAYGAWMTWRTGRLRDALFRKQSGKPSRSVPEHDPIILIDPADRADWPWDVVHSVRGRVYYVDSPERALWLARKHYPGTPVYVHQVACGLKPDKDAPPKDPSREPYGVAPGKYWPERPEEIPMPPPPPRPNSAHLAGCTPKQHFPPAPEPPPMPEPPAAPARGGEVPDAAWRVLVLRALHEINESLVDLRVMREMNGSYSGSNYERDEELSKKVWELIGKPDCEKEKGK